MTSQALIFFALLAFVSPTAKATAADVGLRVQSGDVIVRTSKTSQSYAIMWASQSLYSHVGIIEVEGNKKFVIEAVAKVGRTPLAAWIKRGRLNRYAVFRYEGITGDQQNQIIVSAKKYIGRPYDLYFAKGDDALYCSELVDLAYKGAGLPIGKFESVRHLNIDNFVVRRLIKERWRGHPACKKAKSFEECWQLIQGQDLITPVSLTEDPHMKKIWSNYP